ncbi:EAL domain-containing protein [Sporosarcina siberiensis]|uniref:EAL domain-containing protein n=1 Tax=Sporosarcina siberiensis TaxID=1365606 RepID=A0ABW4SBV5_9BACL
MSTQNKKRKLKEYLELEQHSYTDIFENSPDILLFLVDLKGIIMKVWGSDSRISGIVGKQYQDFVYHEDVEKVNDFFLKVFSGESYYIDYRVKDMKNGFIHVGVSLVAIRGDDQEVIGFYGLMHNISEKLDLIKENQQTHKRLESLLHHADEIIGILDSEGTIVFESRAIEAVLGFGVGEGIGENYSKYIHADDLPLANLKFKEVLQRPDSTAMLEVRLKHNKGYWREFKITLTNHLNDPSLNGIIYNLHDITEIKKQQKEIRYMAYHDYLTGLPNRRSFEDRLELETRLANVDDRKFAVMFLNLDGFKYLNDSLGHEVGDLLLIEVAEKLNRSFPQYIEIIARIDGDEFAVLTKPLHDVALVENIANEILQLFEQPFEIKDYNLSITSCIGIAIYPESGNDTSSLMKNTDLALYLAENEGKNNYQIFSPKANIGTYKLFSLRNDLQKALENNEFVIHYQPIVHSETKQIRSAEALIRWNHPKWGIVSPSEFIPLAEESGLIIPIGEWVLRTVCRNLSIWHKAGYFIKASVNLSPAQFFRKDLVEIIHQVLQENELDSKWLNLEITESTMLKHNETNIEKISKLRKLGIQISIDDFGTGYASFKSLRELKPDILKLDQSFIKELPTDQASVEIVTSIVQLAKRLSITVVAEGVETMEQHRFLSEIQCDWLQGYLFSPPVPEASLLKLLKGQWTTEVEAFNTKQRRAYFRIELENPLEALMTVAELNGEIVHLGNTKVLIEDIGPGGLGFISNIKLPVKAGIVLKFQITILGEDFVLYGSIVHTSERDNLYQYGINFILDEEKRDYLIKHFNQFQLRLRNEPLLDGHSFVVDCPDEYFKKN